MKLLHLDLLLNLDPQENKNLIMRVPSTSRTDAFQKAYSEIEEYIVTKKTPTAHDNPGEVITQTLKSYPKKEKKKNIQILIMEVP